MSKNRVKGILVLLLTFFYFYVAFHNVILNGIHHILHLSENSFHHHDIHQHADYELEHNHTHDYNTHLDATEHSNDSDMEAIIFVVLKFVLPIQKVETYFDQKKPLLNSIYISLMPHPFLFPEIPPPEAIDFIN